MAKKDSRNPGFQQAAGLIRYFDAEEETALKINPYFVLIGAFLMAIVVMALKYFDPLKPA
ncbi:MAG: preprotein translocase subunit Sec61beta [Euryarchaeota archaeon]|nr:preprotein translocase subunit Sec61beta [Euryarchaeota archaeon]